MAKGLRASTKKANKKILRQKVFGPVEDARKERLSAKLLELASKSQARPAEVDGKVAEEKKEAAEGMAIDGEVATSRDDMDVDEGSDTVAVKGSKSRGIGRIQKRRRGKATSAICFPVYKNGKRLGEGKK